MDTGSKGMGQERLANRTSCVGEMETMSDNIYCLYLRQKFISFDCANEAYVVYTWINGLGNKPNV